MKNISTILKYIDFPVIVTLIIVAISFTVLNCNNRELSKIPITTSSEKALEYFNEGIALAEKLRGQEAVYYYLKAIAEDKEFAMAYMQLALVQTTPKLVFKYLNKAKLLSKNISEGEKLAILAIEAGFNNDREKQNDYYLKLIEKYPNDERIQNIYGNLLYGLSRYKDAIKHLEIALEINPELSQPYNMLGYAYRQLGDYNEAEKYFKQYIEIIQDDPNPYDSYAELLLKKGDFEESIEYYRRALELQPKFIPSRIGIATNLTLLDKHEEACDELEKIELLSSNPGDLKQMHVAKAVVNVDHRNFDSAIAELKMNISISKDIKDDLALGQDLMNLGGLYLMQDDFENALRYSEKSIDYFERADISQELKYYIKRQLFVSAARVAWRQNDIEKLIKYTKKYKSSAQKTLNLNEIRNVHELTGHIYLLEERYEDAIYEYKQADLENPIILFMMGTAYEELGDYKKSQKIYKSVAHFNSLNDMNYAFIRKTALEKLDN